LAVLYLDHNVPRPVVPFLQVAGHDVLTARDLNATRLTDDAQLLIAAQRGRILVTHNRRDFTLLHQAWVTWPAAMKADEFAHPGILVLDAVAYDRLATVMVDFFNRQDVQQLRNSILWWRRSLGWRRLRMPTTWEAVSFD
jgi:hypothetical protein